MKQTKKGFTLVELLVVIAILAILATVSVVGYTSFIQKAHESNDRTLVAQLNLAVTRVDGGKYETMHEVVEAVKAQGFDVAKMQATAADQAILWDMDAQEFFYSADEERTESEIWVVSDEVSATYNTYYIGSAEIETSASTTICIATEGGNLSIDAENANVEHYGEVANLDIKAVAGNSYHEFGTVTGLVTVSQGHVVVEEGSYIAQIVVKSTGVTLDGKFGVVMGSEEVISKLGDVGETQAVVTDEDDIANAEAYNATAKQFQSLAEAIAQGGTISLLKDIEIVANKPYTVAAGATVVLDLNGHTVGCVAGDSSGSEVIKNNGNLTIKDSIGSGKITTSALNPDTNSRPSYASNNITNCGTLVIEGGLIENTTVDAEAAYCVDNYHGSTFNMSGGELVSACDAVRIYGNGNNALNVTITGGTISAEGCAIWLHMDANPTTVNLTITGGTFNDLNKGDNWRTIHAGKSDAKNYSNVSISIIGGTVNGDIYFQALAHTGEYKANIQIQDVNVSGQIIYDTDDDRNN